MNPKTAFCYVEAYFVVWFRVCDPNREHYIGGSEESIDKGNALLPYEAGQKVSLVLILHVPPLERAEANY